MTSTTIWGVPASKRVPCEPYPKGASYKSIGVLCGRCGTVDCWIRYLLWEADNGIDLNSAGHDRARHAFIEVQR